MLLSCETKKDYPQLMGKDNVYWKFKQAQGLI